MTGCRYPSNPHIQSMLYAMDRKGLPIVVNGGAIYDCKKRHDHAGLDFESFRWKIIMRYEIKMSELIMKAGYGTSSVVRPTTLFRHNITRCLNKYGNELLSDPWYGEPLIEYFGRIPTLDDVTFLKCHGG